MKQKKMLMFCSKTIPTFEKASVIYCLTCRGFNKKYIGKTDHNLVICLNNQVSRDGQPMYQHLSRCEHYNHIVILMKLPNTDSATSFGIVDNCSNWSQLLF